MIPDRASTNTLEENKLELDKEHENVQLCTFSHSHANAERDVVLPEGEGSALRDGLR